MTEVSDVSSTAMDTWNIPNIPKELQLEKSIEPGSLISPDNSKAKEDKPEAIVDNDTLALVVSSAANLEGKSHSPVKLFIRYEKNPTLLTMGSGWLITPDTVLTAGHSVYDRSDGHNLGRAVEITAYLGQDEKALVDIRTAQGRYGIKASAKVGWLQNGQRINDLGIIQLNQPFTDVNPFGSENTTIEREKTLLGVVGFPGDKVTDSDGQEAARQMYDMLFNRPKFMLANDVSTFNTTDDNSPVKVLANAKPDVPISKDQDSSADPDTEEFLDIFNTVMLMSEPTASNTASAPDPYGFLGPIGKILGPLAGIALNAAAKHTESTGAKSVINDLISSQGVVERAILGEAALQTMSRCMSKEEMRETGTLKSMAKVYNAHVSQVKKLSLHLAGALDEPGLCLALDSIHEGEPLSEPTIRPKRSIPGADSLLDDTTADFHEPLNPDVRRFAEAFLRNESEVISNNFFYSHFAEVLKKGLIVGVPILTDQGVDKFDAAVHSKDGAEAARGLPAAPQGVLDRVVHRPLVAEAALQSIVRLPPQILNARHLKAGSDLEEEGFFDIMAGVIQKIGPHIMKNAPLVIKNVIPVAKNSLVSSSESVSTPDK